MKKRKTFHAWYFLDFRIKRKQLFEEIIVIDRKTIGININQDLMLWISLLLFVIDELSSLIWERYNEDGFNNLN
jgi:hypothetical protein